MPIDPSIILGIKPIQTENPLDMQSRIMQVQNLKQQGELASRAGARAEEQAKFDDYNRNLDLTAKLASRATDQQSWDESLSEAQRLGVPGVENMPRQFDPGLRDRLIASSMSAKEQLAAKQKERQLDIDAAQAGIVRGDRQDKQNDKMAEALKKDLDADSGRTGNFGKISNRYIQAENLQKLAERNVDKDPLTTREIEELSLGLANMLSGSSGAARAQVEALVPHTWTGKMANVKEWLMSEPYGAGQQKFVEQMMATVGREKEMAGEQMNRIREQRLSSHKEFAKKNPEQFQSMLRSYGMEPGNYDDNLLRKQASKSAQVGAHPQDEQAVQWAKQNPNDPRSAAILKANGVE